MAEETHEMGAWQAFSFGPPLVENGEVTVGKHDEVLHALASNPRTGIGIVEPLHYFFVVSDGRTKESAGLSLYQFGCFMQSLGVTDLFDENLADLSKMGTSDSENIFVTEFVQKNCIRINRFGAEADSITKSDMGTECKKERTPTVYLDRPFVFAIVDNATGLPLFLGIVAEL